MNMQKWFADLANEKNKKSMPILSFPSTSLMNITVKQLISDSDLQAKGMKIIADRCDTLASVSMMDLSVEAEAFGSEIRTEDHEVPTVIGSIIATEEEADALTVPPVNAGRTKLYIDAIEKVCKIITDRPVFAGTIGPFSLSGRLMDMSEIMVNAYTEPDMVHKTLEKTTSFITEYILEFKKAGANGIIMAEPAAGLLSPDLIDEFSTPYVKRIAEAVKDESFAFIYHNCGNTIPLMESIKKIGADGYHFGNAIDMKKMMETVSSDMLCFGNVSPADEFKNGTPESVYNATTKLMEECAKYNNFIPSSGCDIPPLAAWENIDAFFKALEDFYIK